VTWPSSTKATRPGFQIVDTSLFLLCSSHFNVFFIRFTRSSKVHSRKYIPLEAPLRENTEIKCIYQSHPKKSFQCSGEFQFNTSLWGARGGKVHWGTALQAGRSRVPFAIGSMVALYWHNTSGCIMALRSTQPLTEMSTRNTSYGVKAAGA